MSAEFCECTHLREHHGRDGCRICWAINLQCTGFSPATPPQLEAIRIIGEMLDTDATPPDVVRPGRRPSRATVEWLLDRAGEPIRLSTHELVEDVDGQPLQVQTTTKDGGTLRVSLEQLGWTRAEWDDPTITE